MENFLHKAFGVGVGTKKSFPKEKKSGKEKNEEKSGEQQRSFQPTLPTFLQTASWPPTNLVQATLQVCFPIYTKTEPFDDALITPRTN